MGLRYWLVIALQKTWATKTNNQLLWYVFRRIISIVLLKWVCSYVGPFIYTIILNVPLRKCYLPLPQCSTRNRQERILCFYATQACLFTNYLRPLEISRLIAKHTLYVFIVITDRNKVTHVLIRMLYHPTQKHTERERDRCNFSTPCILCLLVPWFIRCSYQ